MLVFIIDLVRGLTMRASMGSSMGASNVAPTPAASPVMILLLISEAMSHPPFLLAKEYL
jgi:hypothetical protein